MNRNDILGCCFYAPQVKGLKFSTFLLPRSRVCRNAFRTKTSGRHHWQTSLADPQTIKRGSTFQRVVTELNVRTFAERKTCHTLQSHVEPERQVKCCMSQNSRVRFTIRDVWLLPGAQSLSCLATQQQHLINSMCFLPNEMHDSNLKIPSGVDQLTDILLLADVPHL